MNPEKINQLAGSITRKYSRDIEGKRFAIHKFHGNMNDIPDMIKKKMSVSKLERADSGDYLILRNDHVWVQKELDLEELVIKIDDWQSGHEIEKSDLTGPIYCPQTGEQVIDEKDNIVGSFGKGRNPTHVGFFGLGESLVFYISP